MNRFASDHHVDMSSAGIVQVGFDRREGVVGVRA
jgi:nucleoside phosphorylase